VIILNERQQQRFTRERYRRYSYKYVIWAGQYYVGGGDEIENLILDIRHCVYGGHLTDLRIPMTTGHLAERIKPSLNEVILLVFDTGLKGERVIFTIIENRWQA